MTARGTLVSARSVRTYDSKIWNIKTTPETFHRQAPGFPMRTRCGIVFDDKTRMTTHSLNGYMPCVVCFAGWGE